MASPRQIRFINQLCDERPTGHAYVQTQLDANKVKSLKDLPIREASNVIGVLLREPKGVTPVQNDTAPSKEAEPGFYVRDGKAFKVTLNKAKTHTYALVWTGTRWEYDPGTARNLRGLEPMTGEQAAALGLASGRCINCMRTLGGESLSAKVSAVIGYGEVCADHNGWKYPKGVAAQRAFLTSRGVFDAEQDKAIEGDESTCSGGVCHGIMDQCSKHSYLYQQKYGRAANE